MSEETAEAPSDSHSDVESAEMSADEIDASFSPGPRPGVVSIELDGEGVVADPEGRTHCLNPVGTIVWQCFDGTSTLEDLSVDLAEAFGADQAVVLDDIIELSRQLGRVGLLEGVAADQPVHQHAVEPEGLPLGTEVPTFELPGLDGSPVALESFRGTKTLLVNWSPQCGFCVRIAAELAELQSDLNANAVQLLMLAIGSPDDNRQLLEEHGLDAPVALQSGAEVSIFAGLGTPVAYLLDEDGQVASELSIGAVKVPELARQAAGKASDQ